MEEIKEIIFTACSALIVGEIIYYVTPKDKLVNCIYALVYTAVILSAVMAITKVDFNFSFADSENPYQKEVDEFVSELYVVETEKELEKIIVEALETVHIKCISIEPVLRVDGENTVELDSLQVVLEYKSDIENARVILKRLMGEKLRMEVTGEK